MITLPVEEQALVVKYNTAAKLNSFLYSNEDCHKLLKEEYGVNDRFDFVNTCNRIARTMTPAIHRLYHDKRCILDNGKTGVIKHELMSSFEGRTFEHSVAFRTADDGTEAPSLWVVVDNNPGGSHLYKLSQITIIE